MPSTSRGMGDFGYHVRSDRRIFGTALFGRDVLAIDLLVVSLPLKRRQLLDGVRESPRRPIAVVIGTLLLIVVLGLLSTCRPVWCAVARCARVDCDQRERLVVLFTP